MTPTQTALFWVVAVAVLAGIYVGVAWARRGPDDRLVTAVFRVVLDVYMGLYHRLRWTPRVSPIPPKGPAIVVANHRSGVDPLALAGCTPRVIHFLMAREYYEQRGLRWLFRIARSIPVNRDGKDLGATKAALKVLREGGVIGIFPEGGIQVEGGPEAADGKAGVGLLALKSGAPLIPAYISGTPSYDSVFLAVITPSSTFVRFGEPMLCAPAGQKPGREEMEATARRVLDRVRGLGEPVEIGGRSPDFRKIR